MPIDLTRLRYRCLMPHRALDNELEWDAKGRYWFKDNGANILAVAHVDTQNPHMRHFKVVKLASEINVFNAQLDDRLGVYLLLDYLPQFGLKYDVLLTLDEENCKSTAFSFTPKKTYNWAFMFDRAGTDVVMYQYEEKIHRDMLKEIGLTLGTGSYSCIADLYANCKAFNFGTAYYDQHTHRHFCIPNLVALQAQKFIQFYKTWHEVAMPHDHDLDYLDRCTYGDYSGYARGIDLPPWWRDDESYRHEGKAGECEFCNKAVKGIEGYKYDGHRMCESCYNEKVYTCDSCGTKLWRGDFFTRPEVAGLVCETCYNQMQKEDGECYRYDGKADKWLQGKWEMDCRKCGKPESMCECMDMNEVAYLDKSQDDICYECGNRVHIGDMVWIYDDQVFCQGCAQEYGLIDSLQENQEGG